MKKLSVSIGFALYFLCTVNFIQASESEEVELAHIMSNLQYFMHKIGLSIAAENNKLAKFYVHELEEAIEEVLEVESYDDYPIGQFTKSILLPAFLTLDEKIESADMDTADEEYEKLIKACNNCHMLTNHEFIKIQRNDANPYLQSFK